MTIDEGLFRDHEVPDNGGLSARARGKREAVRMQAVAWFAEGLAPPEAARGLQALRTGRTGLGRR